MLQFKSLNARARADLAPAAVWSSMAELEQCADQAIACRFQHQIRFGKRRFLYFVELQLFGNPLIPITDNAIRDTPAKINADR